MLRLTRGLAAETGEKNLCLAGGVALIASPTARFCATASSSASGSSPPLAMPAARSARRCAGLPLTSAAHAGATSVWTDAAGAYLGPAYAQDDIEQRLTNAGAKFHVVDDTTLIARNRRGAGGRQGRRLAPGPNGVRPSRAWRPLDPRRPAFAQHAKGAESESEISRELPPLRAVGAARTCRRLVRSRHRQALHAARRRCARRTLPYDDRRRKSSFSASISSMSLRSEIPAVTHVDYSARIQTVHKETQPALSCADRDICQN